jgi:polyphosphate kinase
MEMGSVSVEDPALFDPGEAASTVEMATPGPALPPTEAPPTPHPHRYLNRELSWLDFNARVLALAENPSLPVLERAKFLAIFSQNLDEFFQVRVGGLRVQEDAGFTSGADEDSPGSKLRAISHRVRELLTKESTIFSEEVAPALDAVGVKFSDWDALDDDDRAHLDSVFEEQIFPVLTPLAVDPAHPFPFISNLSLNLAVVVRAPGQLTRRTARVKVPPLLPRFVVMPDGERFVAVEQLISRHLATLFPGMEIVAHHPFRVTRNTDFDTDMDEAEDLLTAVESVLLRRRHSELVVRLEVDRDMSDEVLGLLMRELEIEDRDVYRFDGPLDLGGLWALYKLNRPDLKDPTWMPVTQPRLAAAQDGSRDLFAVLRDGDVLVQHPYDSFETSVEAFIETAAADPSVLAIKQTLYRTSAAEGPIMRALIRAAAEGKQVVCLIELKARFDEEANIARARRLEEAGVHVVYGVVGLKTHAKICLVVRQEADGIRRYGHIGTGNYNPDTASIYEDIGLLTADDSLTSDMADLFNFLTGYSRQRDYQRLLVAPVTLRSSLADLIEEEAERGGGRIVIKVNSLVDSDTIDALYAASQSGTEIDLIVRGICCLVPGVPGLSENIRVRSIVGKYLEHSRIVRFGRDPMEASYFIGSADLMPRNLDRRVEALVPVADPTLRARLAEIQDVLLADDLLAWELGSDGTWRRVDVTNEVNAHKRLEELAVARARQIAAV